MPLTNKQKAEQYRQRQIELKRKRREYSLTDKEHDSVKKLIKKLRV